MEAESNAAAAEEARATPPPTFFIDGDRAHRDSGASSVDSWETCAETRDAVKTDSGAVAGEGSVGQGGREAARVRLVGARVAGESSSSTGVQPELLAPVSSELLRSEHQAHCDTPSTTATGQSERERDRPSSPSAPLLPLIDPVVCPPCLQPAGPRSPPPSAQITPHLIRPPRTEPRSRLYSLSTTLSSKANPPTTLTPILTRITRPLLLRPSPSRALRRPQPPRPPLERPPSPSRNAPRP